MGPAILPDRRFVKPHRMSQEGCRVTFTPFPERQATSRASRHGILSRIDMCMATALQIFDALEELTSGLQPGSEFTLNCADQADLFKLTEKDLMARHLSQSRAHEILSGIWHQNLDPLARTLGVRLVCSDDAPHLLKQ